MYTLRDKRLATRLVILSELVHNRYSTLKPLAERLDLTIQAISDYLKGMDEEGLTCKVEGIFKPTREGVDYLHRNYIELKRFLEEEIHDLDILDMCGAIARTKIKEGDKVGMFMEKGELVAYANRESISCGVALQDARSGEDVGISDLSGIVELTQGKITLIVVESIRSGGTRELDLDSIKRHVKKQRAALLGALGIVSQVTAKKAGLKLDFKFATTACALDAASKGEDVCVLVDSELLPEALRSIDGHFSGLGEKIKYDVVKKGIKGRRPKGRARR